MELGNRLSARNGHEGALRRWNAGDDTRNSTRVRPRDDTVPRAPHGKSGYTEHPDCLEARWREAVATGLFFGAVVALFRCGLEEGGLETVLDV